MSICLNIPMRRKRESGHCEIRSSWLSGFGDALSKGDSRPLVLQVLNCFHRKVNPYLGDLRFVCRQVERSIKGEQGSLSFAI